LRAGVLQLMSGLDGVSVRAATSADFDRVRELLVANALPLDGVPRSLAGFLVAEEGDQVIGVAGVEDCGEYGLLRSAAVAEVARSRGIGRRLVEDLVAQASRDGRRGLYLLTTTAARYFPAFGFVETDRQAVPESVRATREFSEACPASATVMKLDLA
jgi:amino-acid N-acetyltransferase